jgi:hypothetical protein
MATRHPGMTARVFRSHADADSHDIEFWRQLSPADRVLQVWRLSVEQWRLSGRWRDERGLRRSVAHLYRR